MARLDELIQNIPQIQTEKTDNSQAMNILAMRQTISQMIQLLKAELPAAISNMSPELASKITDLKDSVEGMNKAFSSKGENLGKMMPKLQETVGDLKAAIGAIQFPDEVKVSNLSSLMMGLSAVENAVKSLRIPEGVRVTNLSEIDLPPSQLELSSEVIEALTWVMRANKEPSDYIPVRLSNGKAFYEGIGEAVGGAVALAPTPGNVVKGGGTSGVLALSGTSAERITTSPTGITRLTVTVTKGTVAWGFDSTVSAVSGSEEGVLLYPSSIPYDIPINDLSKIYFAGASGRRVCYAYS